LILWGVICYSIAGGQVILRCLHEKLWVISQSLSVFSQPCFSMLDDRDKIQPDQEVSIGSAWSLAQTIDFLLLGVRPLASASQVHESLVSG
jgi:hypothetical protein